jgi:hypothetical protein
MQQITIEQLHQYCDDNDLEVVTLDGFDKALIGLATQAHRDVSVYSYERIIELLMDDMSEEDAEEWFQFNMTGYVDGAPIIVHMEVSPPVGKGVEGNGTG